MATLTATTSSSRTTACWWTSGACGHAGPSGPVFEAASDVHTDIPGSRRSTEAEPELSSPSITSIPTLMAFREGFLVYARPGCAAGPGWSSSSRRCAAWTCPTYAGR